MAIKQYCVGKYSKVNIGHRKGYVPTLFINRGGVYRYSLNAMKTATLALAWAERWAKRVNIRAKGKFAIFTPVKNSNGRRNIIFEELG